MSFRELNMESPKRVRFPKLKKDKEKEKGFN
jgi:hypothetical protein